MDIEVLVTNREFKTKIEEYEGIKVYKVADLGRILSAPISPIFPYWIGKIKADILHFHLPNPTAVMSYLIRNPKGKVVVTWHSDIIRQQKFLYFYKPFLYRFLKRADAIIATSDRYIKSSPHLSKFIYKCIPIPLGIEIGKYESNPRIVEEVKKIKMKHGNRIVLFVGLLRYYKGIQYLIEAMKQVDGKLLIIGQGPMEESLRNLMKDLKIEGKVEFVGVVDDETKLSYFHACDVFCLPSILRSEGFGLSQLEAFACGKPVVSTNLDTGVPYVNQNGVTGLIVEPKNAEFLALAINKLLDDSALREKYGNGAKLRAREEFAADKVIEMTRRVYEKVMSNG
jgi:glycosyltransferase involved in cell wall biosynthesis